MKVGAVAAKEFWGLLRQPQLLLLLLVGPVLIMVAFGLSLNVQNILQPRTLVVVEPGSEGAELFERTGTSSPTARPLRGPPTTRRPPGSNSCAARSTP